ncbi:MAG: WcaI family glycosyltransferase [Opitutales bacterium]|nr:WcaI family glycosyltransferase [Opitutales bacterium]
MAEGPRTDRPPRLILVGINYTPEVTGIAPYNAMLAEWLVQNGWDVEVITTFPYYPAWKKIPGDAGKLYRREEMEGVTVHRLWHYVPARVTALRRMIHEATFLMGAFLRLVTLRRADVLFLVSPPLPLGLLGWIYRFFFRRPAVFHVQDLQPDAAVGLGMLKPGILIRTLYRLEAFAYRAAARVSGISPGMIDAFHKKGVPPAKTLFFPNPVQLPDQKAIPPRGCFREAHSIPQDAFLVSYSGNLGVKQGLGQILEAAQSLRDDSSVRFIICGDGAEREKLEKSVAARGLDSVKVLPIQNMKLYHALLVDSDLCLVTQQANSGAAFFPSKLLTLMAFARPVLATADEESALAELFRDEQCGLLCTPNDAQSFKEAVLFARNHPKEIAHMAQSGYQYVSRFRRRSVLTRISEKLNLLVKKRHRG